MGDTVSRKPHLAMSLKSFEPPQWRDSLCYNKLFICWPVNLTINPEHSLEVLILKLKLQYFGHLRQTADSLGKIEDRRRRGQQRMRWLDDITKNAMNMNLGKLWEMMRGREALPAIVPGVTKSQTLLGDWTAIATNPHKTLDQGKDCGFITASGQVHGHR